MATTPDPARESSFPPPPPPPRAAPDEAVELLDELLGADPGATGRALRDAFAARRGVPAA